MFLYKDKKASDQKDFGFGELLLVSVFQNYSRPGNKNLVGGN